VSCPTEWKLAVYADGELEAEERRPLESHLVGCQTCRELVVALREEGDLLRDVLHEREVASVFSARPTRAHGFALGLLPAVAAFIAATSLFTWIFESSASSLEWFSPLRLRGAVQMSFDFIFMLRDQAPGLLELALAMAALASVSALLTYVVTALSRRWLGTTTLLLAGLLLAATPDPSAAHFGVHEHDNVRVAKGEVHEGTVVAIQGENVDIDGVVTGDVFALAHRVTIRGQVQGNVFVGAQDIEVSGEISGSLHAIGSRVYVEGKIDHNAYVLGENFDLAQDAMVQSDVWMRVDGGVVEGRVGRDVYAAGRWLEIRGEIDRSLWVRDMRVSVMPAARIGGDINAAQEDDETIELSPDAVLGGELHTERIAYEYGSSFARFSEGSFYLFLGLRLAAAFLAGMLLHFAAPWIFGGRLETAVEFFRNMGVGLIALIAIPLALGLVFITLVGIPIALLGGCGYLAALYCSGLLTAALVGTSILEPSSRDTQAFGLPLLLGLFLVMLGTSLPFVGGPMSAVVGLTGMGLLVDRTRRAWRNLRGAAA